MVIMSIPLEVVRETPKPRSDPTKSKNRSLIFYKLLRSFFGQMHKKIMNTLNSIRIEEYEQTIEEFQISDELRRSIRESILSSVEDIEMRNRLRAIVRTNFQFAAGEAMRELYRLGASEHVTHTIDEKDEETVEDLFEIVNGILREKAEVINSGVSRVVSHLFTVGAAFSQIKSTISRLFRKHSKEANTIARTEVIRIYNTGQLQTFAKHGVRYIQWVSAIESVGSRRRTCPVCEKLNGKIVKLGETFNKFITSTSEKAIIRGNKIYVPPDPHPNCRCTIRPAVRISKERPIELPEMFKRHMLTFPTPTLQTPIVARFEDEEVDWFTTALICHNEMNKTGGEARKQWRARLSCAVNNACMDELALYEEDRRREGVRYEHYPLSKDEIYSHYVKHWNDIKPYLENRRVGGNTRWGGFIRNYKGKPITIDNLKDLRKAIYDANLVSLVPEINPIKFGPSRTQELVIDLDPKKPNIRQEVQKVHNLVSQIPSVTRPPEVIQTGGRGFHIRAKLDKPQTWQEARDTIRENVTKHISGDIVDVDLSPMKRRGLAIIPWSIRQQTGNVAQKIEMSEFDEDYNIEREWQPEDAPLGTLQFPTGLKVGGRQVIPMLRKILSREGMDRKLTVPVNTIKILASQLELPLKVQQLAESIYKNAIENELVGRGRVARDIAAATLFLAARDYGMYRQATEFEKIGVNSSTLLTIAEDIDRNLGLGIGIRKYNIQVEDSVKNLSYRLNTPDMVSRRAIDMIKETQYRPDNVAATLLYKAARQSNYKLPMRELQKYGGVSRMTMTKIGKEF